jgi:hypothetical protein
MLPSLWDGSSSDTLMSIGTGHSKSEPFENRTKIWFGLRNGPVFGSPLHTINSNTKQKSFDYQTFLSNNMESINRMIRRAVNLLVTVHHFKMKSTTLMLWQSLELFLTDLVLFSVISPMSRSRYRRIFFFRRKNSWRSSDHLQQNTTFQRHRLRRV